MKKNKFNVFCAWMLLFCFMAGQTMVYVHQHNVLRKTGLVNTISKHQPKPSASVQEKCYMCDAMHHTVMAMAQHSYFIPSFVTGHIYKAGDYNFVSIALVLAAGRAPPVNALSC